MATTDSPTSPPDRQPVSRFEFNLLRLLRFVLGHMPPEQSLNCHVHSKQRAGGRDSEHKHGNRRRNR